MRAIAVVLLLALAQIVLGNHLGNITFTFQEEDPATNRNVDTIIGLGDSLQVTITLSPAPELPIRFDIVSSLPDIIHVTHSRITFNKGQTKGVITVESPPDGKIGIATIIVTPERPGLYAPKTFDVLVQGTMEVGLVEEQCVSVGIPVTFVVNIDPPSPESINVTLTASNGNLSSSNVVIPVGQTSVEFVYTGTTVGPSTIIARTDLYVRYTYSFTTLGTITTQHSNQLIEDTPSYFEVSVVPFNVNNRPNIFVSGENAIVTPTSFTLEEDGVSTVEVIPEFAGNAKITFKANGYCPHSDIVAVANALMCSVGFVPNINGTVCVQCPGHISDSPSIDCNDEGTCGYSKCFHNSAVCFCFYPYIGYACQFNSLETGEGLFDQDILDSHNFRLSLHDLPQTSGATKFLAPGNLIDPQFQPGRAIVAGFYPDNLFYNAVDPTANPPTNSQFTGVGWYWENTCDENALIRAPFRTAPVSVQIPINEELFTSFPLGVLQVELFLYNTTSKAWVRSIDACKAVGYNTTFFVDFYEFTVTTAFCYPGQYALFSVPNVPAVPNTGITNPPNPGLDSLNGVTPGTGKTGWQPAPPLPVAVPEDLDAYRPSFKETDSSSSVLSVSLALLAVICMVI